MLSFFRQNNLSQNEPIPLASSPSSWFGTLYSAYRWVSPRNIDAGSVGKALLFAMAFMRPFTANAYNNGDYLEENGAVSPFVSHRYSLRCEFAKDTEAYYKLLVDNCNLHPVSRNYALNDHADERNYVDFGYALFGRPVCVLTRVNSNLSLSMQDSCIVEMLRKNVRDTYIDEAICIAGVGCGWLFVLVVEPLLKRRREVLAGRPHSTAIDHARLFALHRRNVALPPPLQIPLQIIGSAENRYDTFKKELNELSEMNSEACAPLREAFNQFEEDDKYHCNISLSTMEVPVSLDCGHHFDKVNVEAAIQTNCRCPTCRRPVNDNEDIKVNEKLKLEVDMKFSEFETALSKLKETLQPERRVMRRV